MGESTGGRGNRYSASPGQELQKARVTENRTGNAHVLASSYARTQRRSNACTWNSRQNFVLGPCRLRPCTLQQKRPSKPAGPQQPRRRLLPASCTAAGSPSPAATTAAAAPPCDEPQPALAGCRGTTWHAPQQHPPIDDTNATAAAAGAPAPPGSNARRRVPSCTRPPAGPQPPAAGRPQQPNYAGFRCQAAVLCSPPPGGGAAASSPVCRQLHTAARHGGGHGQRCKQSLPAAAAKVWRDTLAAATATAGVPAE